MQNNIFSQKFSLEMSVNVYSTSNFSNHIDSVNHHVDRCVRLGMLVTTDLVQDTEYTGSP